jgi:hypothetical protein
MATGRTRRSRWLVGAAACLMAVLVLAQAATLTQAQAARSAASPPVAHTACRHYDAIATYPCWVGDVVVVCNYIGCESSKYLHCKLSEDLGERVAVDGNPEKGFITRHPHKRVTCKGSAAVLKVYSFTNKSTGPSSPLGQWRLVQENTGHTLVVVVNGHQFSSTDSDLVGESLVIMAQRPASASVAASTRPSNRRIGAGTTAHAACRHIIGKYDPHEPCIVGNVDIECGYITSTCVGACGLRDCAWQKYLNCHVSEELGEMSYVDNNPEKGYIYKHPHKRVTCKGPATILKVYTRTPTHTSAYAYQEVPVHSAHSLSLTIQGHYAGPDSASIIGAEVVVMAQRA